MRNVLGGTWPPTEPEHQEAQRRDAVFRLRLWTWLVQKNGRPRRGKPKASRYVVMCRRCARLVTMPTRLGPAEHERMRLHLKLHGRFFTPTEAELLRQFDVKPRRVR